ncbi:MAG TPA: glycosyltransferase family 39 protein, partial [Polyangiaceae bacterium]
MKPASPLPARTGWREHLDGALLGLAYVLWLLPGARTLGFPRDEGIYFRAGSEYFRWWRLLWDDHHAALQRGAIDGAFGINHEHPPLMKTLFGASEWFFHEKWHVFTDASTAFRFPGMLSAGLAVWVTYLFATRLWDRRAGVVAAALLAFMPRVFFHAHLACFDVPIMAMWTLAIYLYWRAIQTRRVLFILAAGLAYG